MSVFGPRDDRVRERRSGHVTLQGDAGALHFTATEWTSRDPRRHYVDTTHRQTRTSPPQCHHLQYTADTVTLGGT